MAKKKVQTDLIAAEVIAGKILVIRGQKVILDRELAGLYGVETKVLKQGVRRNIERFPNDFMFQLDKKKWNVLKSQIVTLEQDPTGSKKGRHSKYPPFVFTEQGVAMLSGILKSKKAVNIAIMRTFVNLRQMMATHVDRARKIKAIEKKYDEQFQVVFEAIQQLIDPPEEKKKGKIGFTVKEKQAQYRSTSKKRKKN